MCMSQTYTLHMQTLSFAVKIVKLSRLEISDAYKNIKPARRCSRISNFSSSERQPHFSLRINTVIAYEWIGKTSAKKMQSETTLKTFIGRHTLHFSHVHITKNGRLVLALPLCDEGFGLAIEAHSESIVFFSIIICQSYTIVRCVRLLCLHNIFPHMFRSMRLNWLAFLFPAIGCGALNLYAALSRCEFDGTAYFILSGWFYISSACIWCTWSKWKPIDKVNVQSSNMWMLLMIFLLLARSAR